MRRLRHAFTCVLAVLVVAFGPVAPAQAQAGPELTGTVTDSSGPIGWPVLDLYRLDDEAGWTFVAEVTGAQDGAFAVPLAGLAAGAYTVKFSDGDHESRWLGGTGALPATVGAGNHFTLPREADVAVGTVVLPVLGRLSVRGRVDGPAGSSRQGLLVQIARSELDLAVGQAVDHVATTEDGSFSLSVSEPGEYVVQVSDPSHALASVTEQVEVAAPGTDLGRLTLRDRNPSIVTGTVSAGGNPLAGVAVTTLVWHDELPLWPEAAFVAYASATSASDGSFSVPVEPGACFTVRYTLAGFATGHLDAHQPATCPDAKGTRTARPAPGAANPVPGVTFVRTHKVSGTVLSPLGTGVGFAAVSAYPAGRAGEEASLVTVGYADKEGGFTLLLPAGDYAFRFTGTDVPVAPVTRDPVTVTADTDLGAVTVEPTRSVSGRIASAAGPLEGATATLTVLSGSQTGEVRESVTKADGSYEFGAVEAGTRFRLAWAAHGYETITGEEEVMPAGSLARAVVTLAPAASDLGRLAGERVGYCTANRLPPGDDTASAAVQLPFPVRFFGTTYTSLFVNANGSVSFTRPRAAFLPGQLDATPVADAADADAALPVPMIAPFLADIDTSHASDRLVSYGSDAGSFCVQWADARQYGGQATDTFQLVLRKAVADGDFDLVLNYDRLAWDTGSSPQGVPASAVAGFGDGTGAPGSSVRFAGSGTAGSLLDGGVNALVGGSQNATGPGRYVIPFRGADTAGFGTLSGSLAGADGLAAAGVVVGACRPVGTGTVCDTTTSRADGSFAFLALFAAEYRLELPEGQEFEHSPATVAVSRGQQATAGLLRLRPKPSPEPSASVSPSPSPEPSASVSPSPSVSLSPSPPASPKPSPPASSKPSPSTSPKPSPSASPKPSPSRPSSPSASSKPSLSASPKPSPTPSRRPIPPVVVAPDPLPTGSSSASVRPSPPPTPTLKALSPAKPRITGTRRVGRTLKAKPGSWRPSGVTFGYQWLRAGKPIKGATKSKYRLKNADRGRGIRVVVTGRKSGYVTLSRTSATTAKVKRR